MLFVSIAHIIWALQRTYLSDPSDAAPFGLLYANLVTGLAGVVWCFSGSTFGYPIWVVLSMIPCVGWLQCGDYATAFVAFLLVCTARMYRHAILRVNEQSGMHPSGFSQQPASLFLGERPLPPPQNWGRVEPSHIGVAAPKRLLIIVNPTAGSGQAMRSLAAAEEVFEAAGVSRVVRQTTKTGDGFHQAKDYTDDVDAVVVIGGDGTLSEVLNGLMARTGPIPVMGVIPGGTCNNFCFDLGLTVADADVAAKRIVEGKMAEVDAAEVKHSAGTTYALNTIAWGVGLRAVQLAQGLGWLGPAKFDVGGLIAILTFDPAEITMTLERSGHEKRVLKGKYVISMTMLCQRAGNGFRFGPAAKLDDGLLDAAVLPVCLLQNACHISPHTRKHAECRRLAHSRTVRRGEA